jgi:hypothetical protein
MEDMMTIIIKSARGFGAANEFLVWGIRAGIILKGMAQIIVGVDCHQEVGKR